MVLQRAATVITVAFVAVLGYADSFTVPKTQTGMASYYCCWHNGRKMANGEIFDENKMTCAHRTLPLGSVILVTNLCNGWQVHLTVTDRGPYIEGCILDVSLGAAKILGFEKQGLTEIRLEVIE